MVGAISIIQEATSKGVVIFSPLLYRKNIRDFLSENMGQNLLDFVLQFASMYCNTIVFNQRHVTR